MRRALLLTCLALLVPPPAYPQPSVRTATTIEALGLYPLFFHGKHVVVRGTVERPAPEVASVRADAGSRPVFLMARSGPPEAEGLQQVRGEFYDLGRLTQDDPRVTGLPVESLLARTTEGRWPGHNQVLILVVQEVEEPEQLPAGLRALALEPARHEGQAITVTGRFRGANLYGDLPQSPGKSRWDFVIQSADAAVWVTGMRPRGKGFNFDPVTRLDTGRSLEVTGVVRHDRGLVWIEARELALAANPAPAAIVEVPVRALGPPPAVAFSLPLDGDTDVSPTVRVRVQFTRDMTPESFRDRVRVSYAGAPGTPPENTSTYRRDNRVLEIVFGAPLERFRTVKIELLEGITATDGVALPPWAMTFSVGSGG